MEWVGKGWRINGIPTIISVSLSVCGRGERDREGGGCIRAIIMQRWGKSGELSEKKQMTLE